MSKHTHGEWKVDERASLRVHHDYKTIASCGGYVASENAEEAEANAKLIACAPELLGLLREVIIESGGNMEPNLFRKIQAAIKKATN